MGELICEIPLIKAGRLQGLRAAKDFITVTTSAITLQHGHYLKQPLVLPLRIIAVAAVDYGSTSQSSSARFAVLRRLSDSAVIPFEEGIEGWLWTKASGSVLPVIAADEAPNVALILAHRLREGVVRSVFAEEFIQAMARHSPLGVPTVSGLLLGVVDVLTVERAFVKLGLESLLTDREIPPPLRRSLLTDKSADLQVRIPSGRSLDGSVPPPGLG